MAFDNKMKGVLFNCQDKKRTETDRDYNGSCEIEGVEYWISSWINTAGPNAKKPGQKYMALQFEAKESKEEPVKPAYAPPSDDDDIPF